MSDTQQGPGWWLASDGRWYPPESHPQRLPAPPPTSVNAGAPVGPPTAPSPYGLPQYPPIHQAPYPYAHVAPPPHSLPSGLGGTIQGFSWALLGLSVIAAVLSLASLATFNSYWSAPVNSRAEDRAYDDWIAVDDAFSGFAGLTVICGLVLFVLLIIWSHHAHRASQQLWHGDRQWTAGWAIGGWFIPAANLVIPKLVLGEIERIAMAPRAHGTIDASWKSRSTIAIGKLWWAGYIVALVLTVLAAGFNGELASDTDLRIGYVLNCLGFVALAVGGAFGALYVRRIGRRLSATGIIESP